MVVAASLGPFRGFVPFDEASSETFFGRATETEAVARLVLSEGMRVAALSGAAGVGKTSLVRAALAPTLNRRGVLTLVLGSYADLEAEIVRATGRAGADPPAPGEPPADYLARVARGSRSGSLLVLDHLEAALSAGDETLSRLASLLSRVSELAGPRLRLLYVVDASAFHRLDRLTVAGGPTPQAGAWMTLEPLGEAAVTEIVERTALQAGIFLEAGLPQEVARDLTQNEACLPLDLQIVARTLLDMRLVSIKKYHRSGGGRVLRQMYFERLCADSGGATALRVLLDLADHPDAGPQQIQERTQVARARIDETLQQLSTRGAVRSRRAARGDLFSLTHEALLPRVREFAADERARAENARRVLRRRLMSGERLTVREVRTVRRHLGAALAPDEEALVRQSVRRKLLQVSVGALALAALLVAVFLQLRRSYTLAFDPANGRAEARVVVKLGRPSLSFLYFLPNRPAFGSILADTGFAAAGMAEDTAARIAAGRASGTLERGGANAVPAWLRDTLNGLRPVPRGVARVLLDDPSGLVSLKHAFADPLSRRETLDALAVIGRGRAGEDEILAEALRDKAPEIRRRAVEVAAAISRRPGLRAPDAAPGVRNGHAATLRAALGDPSIEVRATALTEAATLPAAEASDILAAALGSKDLAFRRAAAEAIMSLATRDPAAAAHAARQAAQDADPTVRRESLTLFERVVARAPKETADVAAKLAADESAPEEARVAALQAVRRSDAPAEPLRPALEKAVRPEASPRLRAAALPLYARLVDPAAAEEIARTETRGGPDARAAGAAVWGTVAMKRPEVAAQPLKSFLYDPSAETRMEAARSLAFLKRDGLPLVERALKDANADVQKAAIESALALAPASAYAVADLLGKAIKTARPAVRKQLVDALARLAESKPAVVVGPLSRALKEKGDGALRAAAAGAFCVVARKSAGSASPYLRIAARDENQQVRAAAAACLGELAKGDPRGAARLATELAGAAEPSVRAAAAESLGHLGGKGRDASLAALLKLLADGDRSVRMAAEHAVAALAEGPEGGLDKRAADVEHALAAVLPQSDAEEATAVVAAALGHRLVPVLRQALTHGDDEVRVAAIRAAGSLKPPALDLVSPAVDDRSHLVRAEALRLLAGAPGAGALPIFEAMLRGGDAAAREAAVKAVGALSGAGDAASNLLGGVLAHPSESVRATAARALGRLAESEPDHALPHLERALRDSSYDVRSAAIPGLALAWARKKAAAELADIMIAAEADSPRRFVALEALVVQTQDEKSRAGAEQALGRVADSGAPLARLAAQIGRGFVGAKPGEMHTFLERLLGG